MNSKIQNILKNKIDENHITNFISQLNYKKLSADNKTIYFEVPNRFISTYINTKFIKILEKNLKTFEIFKKIEKIDIAVRGDIKKTKKEQILDEQYEKDKINPILNPAYTFESFVVGSSNQMAYTVSKTFVEKGIKQYNPIFIYGDTGLGKTHLLQAVGNESIKSGKKVIYLTAEDFMNDFTFSIKKKSMPHFRDKYRKCDILLLDDIQYLTNKEKTQDEFFHTFNYLHSTNKQIIMTSDRMPSQIPHLIKRLKTRFEWGMIADIKPPKLETKINIIKKKSEINGIDLNNEIINYIAVNVNSSIREIESIIIRINASVKLLDQTLDIHLVKQLLKNQIKEKNKEITIIDIIKMVSKVLNIKANDLKSAKRMTKIVQARRIVIFLSRKLTINSMPDIAKHLQMKNHSSITKNIKKTQHIINEDEDFKLLVDDLEKKIIDSKN